MITGRYGDMISIHALREEGDLHRTDRRSHDRGISIHALREEGDCCMAFTSYVGSISIHALREEGDAGCPVIRRYNMVISIHALREEGDVYVDVAEAFDTVFLSTPSARRATRANR